MDDDGFTTVRRSGRERGNRSLRVAQKEKTTSNISYMTQTFSKARKGDLTTEQKLAKVLAILETRKRQLLEEAGNGGKGKEQSFLASWTDQLAAVKSVLREPDVKAASATASERRFTRIICLGIGITNESRESQFQFVLLDMLQEAFEIPTHEVRVYDPLFTAVEIKLLENRGYQLLPKNECGKHELDPNHTTLVYMPHCPGKLYDAFVRQNWDERLLGAVAPRDSEIQESKDGSAGPKAVLLANDFRGYIDNLPRRRVEEELPALSRLTPHLSGIAFPSLPPSHIASNAFNSLVFQYVRPEESRKIDWGSRPPAGVQKEMGQTEVIEGELQVEYGVMVDEEELSRKLADATISGS